MPRRRPDFGSGLVGAEAAKLKKFSDGGGSQNLWLSDAGRTDSSITSGIPITFKTSSEGALLEEDAAAGCCDKTFDARLKESRRTPVIQRDKDRLFHEELFRSF